MTGAGPGPAPGSAAWTPILSGRAASEALEVARAITRDLRRTALSVEAALELDVGPASTEAVASLGEGLSGIALALSYLGGLDSRPAEPGGAKLAVRALAAISRQGSDPSFFGGLAGAAWVVAHLERRGGVPADGLLRSVDQEVLDVVSRTPWEGAFDLVAGLSGLGTYALERLPGPAARRILEQVVDRLAETAESRDGGCTWWTSPALLPEERRTEFPLGHYNLGVAHGTPGVAAFLGRVVAAGVATGRASGLLEKAFAWLLGQRLDAGGGCFAKWSGAGLAPVHRQAWCYGDPGVAATLLLAARSSGNESWEREALDIAVLAASRPPERAGVVDAALCHGSAGLGHVYNRLWQASGDERLRSAAVDWFGDAIRRLRAGDAAAEPSFLQGSSGAALALLSAATATEPEWDRALLLSGARVRSEP